MPDGSKFYPKTTKDGRWTVRIITGRGPDSHVGDFETEEEAQRWISTKSKDWEAAYSADNSKRSPNGGQGESGQPNDLSGLFFQTDPLPKAPAPEVRIAHYLGIVLAAAVALGLRRLQILGPLP